MSKSYRRPYGTCVNYRSCKWDKQQANRGLRRRINHWIHSDCQDEEFDLVPHPLECHHNDPWGWARDGRKRPQVPDARAWSNHMLCIQGLSGYDRYESYKVWPPKWYVEETRK